MKPPEHAVIVAAGLSTRIDDITEGTPKALLPIGDETILQRSIRILRRADIHNIVIVVGSNREMIMEHANDISTFVFNPFYSTTNNLASLWFARDHVSGKPFIHIHGDLVYHEEILSKLLDETSGASIAVETGRADDEAMKVEVGENYLLSSSKQIPKDRCFGEWIGMSRYSSETSAHMFEECEAVLAEGEFQAYDTLAMSRLAAKGEKFRIVPINGLPWVEVDFPDDYRQAKKLFDRNQC